jgi:hypothetical protein
MKLVIIVEDSAVYKDGAYLESLTLSGIPGNVSALQWDADSGEIEYNDGTFNESIDVLPDWAVAAEATYDAAVKAAQNVELTAEEKLQDLRDHRNALLRETDWWGASDLTMTQDQIAYRQALRDITSTYSSLDDAVFPEKPE